MEKKKILIIDDDPDSVEVLKVRLEVNNYDVITAYDGGEGLIKAKDDKHDLIVLDVIMPNMNGYSFMQEFRVTKEIKTIPIIVLTGKDQLQDFFKIESEQYIVKPFDAKVLLEKIKGLVEEGK